MRKSFILLLVIIQGSFVFSNQTIIDSLKRELEKEVTIKQRCEIYLNISEYIYVFSSDSMYHYSKIAYNISQEALEQDNNNELELVNTYAVNNIGSYYNDIGEIDTALFLYEKAFKGFEKADDKMGMAIAANNIGYIYNNFKVDIPRAIDYYNKSIEYLKDIEANYWLLPILMLMLFQEVHR